MHSYGVDASPRSAKAISDASRDPSVLRRHYFVDDSALNMRGAKSFGLGSCVYFFEDKPDGGPTVQANGTPTWDASIKDLEELKHLEGWKECWTPTA